MNCQEMNTKLPDVLLGPDVLLESDAAGNTVVMTHLESCASCSAQLNELRATMALLDTWEAPEPNPYFMTRLNARLEEERASAPASWPERVFAGLRARFVYGSRMTMRPVAAMAMTVAVLAGGGAYFGISSLQHPAPPPETAVVHDLQTLDSNAQLLDQLETMSNQNDD
jgi:hypothetical protein